MSERGSSEGTHTECFWVKNWAPDRLRTCFRHQIASKRCDQFTDLVRIAQNWFKIIAVDKKKVGPEKMKFFTPCFDHLDRRGIVDLGGVATRDGG